MRLSMYRLLSYLVNINFTQYLTYIELSYSYTSFLLSDNYASTRIKNPDQRTISSLQYRVSKRIKIIRSTDSLHIKQILKQVFIISISIVCDVININCTIWKILNTNLNEHFIVQHTSFTNIVLVIQHNIQIYTLYKLMVQETTAKLIVQRINVIWNMNSNILLSYKRYMS